jgi:hypothetical protein
MMNATDARFDVAVTHALQAVEPAIPLLLVEPAKRALVRLARIHSLLETPRSPDDESESGNTLLSQPETVSLLSELSDLVGDMIGAVSEYPRELCGSQLADLVAAATALAAERDIVAR